MAIYHCSVQVIGRSSGKSSVASSAYRAAEKIKDERTGLAYDYTKKIGVDFKEILTPEGSPSWMKDRSKLWNKVEAVEKRKDAQVAREINIALPIELNKKEQIELLKEYVEDNFVKSGMVADVALHNSNGSNPHAHIMLTTREISSEGFGNKNREWNDKELLEIWRASWSEHANHALARAGSEHKIDHRSLKEQEIERVPEIHVGVYAWAMEKKGIETDRGSINREIKEINKQIEEIHKTKFVVLKEYEDLNERKKLALKKQDDLKKQAEKEAKKMIETRNQYFEKGKELVKVYEERKKNSDLKNDMKKHVVYVHDCGFRIEEYTKNKEEYSNELKKTSFFSFKLKKELEGKIESNDNKIQEIWDTLENLYDIKKFDNNIDKLKESIENYVKKCEDKDEQFKVEIQELNDERQVLEKEYKYLSLKSKIHDVEYKHMVLGNFNELLDKNKDFENEFMEKSLELIQMFIKDKKGLDSLTVKDLNAIWDRFSEKEQTKIERIIERKESHGKEREKTRDSNKGWSR